jgi:Domain of unknown function (DUF5615)
VRIQDILPKGAPDSEVLSWATGSGRVLITNDRNSMVSLARRRATAGEAIPGLIATTNKQPIGAAIDDILCIAECMSDEELRNQVVVFLPLR